MPVPSALEQASLAANLLVPVVAACQLNRAIESGMNDDGDTRRPALADLRDSGNIEEEADQVVFIWGGKRKEIRREQILSVEKNRHGEQKDIRIVFDRARQRIRELPRHGGPPPATTGEGKEDGWRVD